MGMTYEKGPWNQSRVLGAHIVPGLNPLVAGSWGNLGVQGGAEKAATTAVEDSVSDYLPTSTKVFPDFNYQYSYTEYY